MLNIIKNIFSKNARTSIKVSRYFTFELLYTLFAVMFLFWITDSYTIPTNLDNHLFSIVLMGLIGLIWFIGPMLNRYFVFVYLGIYSLYIISQDVYYTAFNQYYRFNTAISLQNEAIGVASSAQELIETSHIIPFIILLIFTIIFVLFYFLFQRRCFKLIFRLPLKLAVLLLYFPITNEYLAFNQSVADLQGDVDAFQINQSDLYIYNLMPNVNQFVEKFGLLTYAHRDFLSLYDTPILSQEQYDEVEAFLSELPEATTNDMTGIFEGKNVLFIQAESYMNILSDPDLTPTIYMLQNEGINIQNFNTPTLPGSTSDTEFMANTSIIPNSDGYSVSYKYPYNVYPTTLPQMFADAGYIPNAYHNNFGTFYNREIVFPNLGYDKLFTCTDFVVENMSADSVYGAQLDWILSEYQSKYMGYWITYSGHQPYTLDEVGVSSDDVEKIREKYPNLSDEYVAYWAKTMDLDRILGDLISHLKQTGDLDNFVFVFFGDHIVKGLDFSEGSAFYQETGLQYEYDDMYTDLYIYNSTIQPMVYEKVSTTLDFIPTFANLFNLEYDSSTVLGRDIFDPTYEGFHMDEWGLWETDNFKYSLTEDKFYLDEGYSEEQAREDISYYLYMKEIAKKILQLDYFNDNKDDNLVE